MRPRPSKAVKSNSKLLNYSLVAFQCGEQARLNVFRLQEISSLALGRISRRRLAVLVGHDLNFRVGIASVLARVGLGRSSLGNPLLNSWMTMDNSLTGVLQTLRAHEQELRRLGASHAAVFGSVARGEARSGSDIDVLVDLDQERPMGIFEYARLKLYIGELLDGASDVVNRKTLKPLLRENILRDAVDAF